MSSGLLCFRDNTWNTNCLTSRLDVRPVTRLEFNNNTR